MALVSLRVSGFTNPLQISASISVSRNSMITQRGPRVGVGDVGACALPQNYSSRILAPIQEGISILPWIECGGDAEPGIRPPECGSRFDVRFTDVSACPLSAKRGRTPRSKKAAIRSPRRRAGRKASGIDSPNALAVLRLTRSANVVGSHQPANRLFPAQDATERRAIQ